MPDKSYPWLDRQAYPFTHHYFDVESHKMHYVDEGQGPTILFVHGTPSWSFDYRHLISKLSTDFRCIAIDLMGFGLSDKPKDYDYSTPTHVRVLTQFIEYLGLSDLHLVLHDFGGVIGMAYALERPKHIKSITLFNSWLWDASNEPEFQQSAKILSSPLLPFLYLRLNFSPRFLARLSFAFFFFRKTSRGENGVVTILFFLLFVGDLPINGLCDDEELDDDDSTDEFSIVALVRIRRGRETQFINLFSRLLSSSNDPSQPARLGLRNIKR